MKNGTDARTLVIDLTPLLPGGENGGAKWLALELIKQFGILRPDIHFVLLALERSRKELQALKTRNMELRILSNGEEKTGWLERCIRNLWKRVERSLPLKLRLKVSLAVEKAFQKIRIDNPIGDEKVDLLFCPFTAPFYHRSNVPTVCTVLDIQYYYYPQFFTTDQYCERDRHFRMACDVASKLICISEAVRQTVLDAAKLPESKVVSILIDIPARIVGKDSTACLTRLGLEAGEYLLYPANFWCHKNHEMLLMAFGMYKAGRPESRLRLVCTGSPGERKDYLETAAWALGIADSVVFPGFLDEKDFGTLLKNAKAVIFPSLYEGFGMPVLEAMANDVPVLCSSVTSLPEVGGDAVLYFDPRKPDEIVDALTRIDTCPQCGEELRRNGRERLKAFKGPRDMAEKYLEVFQSVAPSLRERASS